MLLRLALRLGTACLLLAVRTAGVGADESAWEAWRGLPIVRVEIDAVEVFDPTQPGENVWLFRWINAVHIRTREGVIRREILCRVGEPFDPLRIAESERNLRALGIFQDVAIDVQAVDGGVQVRVRTADRWAMRLLTDISTEGDIYRVRLGLENINFLGRGSVFGGNVVASNDVDAWQVFAAERRLFGSRWDGGYAYASDELAVANEARLGRPYFSELVGWTTDLGYRSIRGDRRYFYDGAVADTLDLDETLAEAFGAVYSHGEARTRLGLLYSRRNITRTLDAHQAALGLCWGVLERRFRRVRNIDRYGSVEDIASGWSLQLGAGADLQALGASADRPLWRFDMTAATWLGDAGVLGLQLRHHGFAGGGHVEEARFSSEVYGFYQLSSNHCLTWDAGFSALVREPIYLRYALGGDNHLRGYPARFDTGTRTLYANVEHRLFTPLQLLFVSFGAAAFVDAGQAWEAGEPLRLDATHVGAGAGLRFGNRKSGTSIFRLDFAFGRDSFEVSVASGSFFRVARDFAFPAPNLYR